jgi:hypothetical protein
MFQIETIFFGDGIPAPRNRFVNLPIEWSDIRPGQRIIDANSEEQTFEFISWYFEADGTQACKCRDGEGALRHLFADAVRLAQLNGRGKMRGTRMTLLSDTEKKLTRTEKRKLRKERRTALNAQGID